MTAVKRRARSETRRWAVGWGSSKGWGALVHLKRVGRGHACVGGHVRACMRPKKTLGGKKSAKMRVGKLARIRGG